MKEIRIRYRHVLRTLVGALAALPMLVLAAHTAQFTVTATVEEQPCVINDNRSIEVEFGEVMTTRVGGNNYKMPINYTLSCPRESSDMLMKFQIKGNTAAFDAAVLQTDKTGLGIELRQDDNKLTINKWMAFYYSNKPALWAIPVKQRSATLTGGEFRAGATMIVDYL
ncbi:fimbrial protein [Serratia fonticola]